MFRFLTDILHRPRRLLAQRKKVSVVSQVFQFRFSENENREIVQGWLHVAGCLGVNPEKLRAVDTKTFLWSLDCANGAMTAPLESLISQKLVAQAAASQQPAATLSDDTTLIELSKIVGYVNGGRD